MLFFHNFQENAKHINHLKETTIASSKKQKHEKLQATKHRVRQVFKDEQQNIKKGILTKKNDVRNIFRESKKMVEHIITQTGE